MRLSESARNRLADPLANTLQAALPWLSAEVCEVIAAAVVETNDEMIEARERQKGDSWALPEGRYHEPDPLLPEKVEQACRNAKTIWGEKSA